MGSRGGPHGLPLLIAGLFTLACVAGEEGPRVELHPASDQHPGGRVVLHGTHQPVQGLSVHVAQAPAGAPAVLGAVRQDATTATFLPRFPLQPGMTYQLRTTGSQALELEFGLPEPSREPVTSILAVAPAARELPANLLKFYLHFSEPMRRGEAYRHVRIRAEGGEVLEGALLPIAPELWNPACTRLTLLLDPARIKQGLVPHEELGPVLLPERDYVLEVDSAWRDGEGRPLLAGLQHHFRTTARDTTSPAPSAWELEVPAAGSRAPLVVHFDEALDSALVHSRLEVELPDGSLVAGSSVLDDDQSCWSFEPERAWRATPHALVVPAVLEDLCGNGVGRPFEVAGSAIEDELDDVRLGFRP